MVRKVVVLGNHENVLDNMSSEQLGTLVELLGRSEENTNAMELKMFSELSDDMAEVYRDIPIKPKKRENRYKSPNWNF